MKRRVVVTGFGAVSTLGLSATALWENLIAGRSGLRFISSFDASCFPIKVAGEISDLPFDSKREPSRTYQLLFMAAREAKEHALLGNLPNQTRSGIFCARSIDWPILSTLIPQYRHKGPIADNPHTIKEFPNYQFGMASAMLGTELEIANRLYMARVIDGACASGGIAVGTAYQHIKHGHIDFALAAGTSSWTNLVGMTIYYKLNTLSPEAQIPGEASRPFDGRRKGFVMAEGAAVLVLEELEHALRRQVEPLAEVTGYGSSTSAYRVTDLPLDGSAQCQAMEIALQDAGRRREEVDYINAHGTSTYQNDLVETRAIRRLFKDWAWSIPVSSNKSMMGHSITASGVLEAIATVQTINQGILPPTINQKNPDPECDLDYVPNVARKKDVAVAMSNSFGFGGQNCTVVIEKFEHARKK